MPPPPGAKVPHVRHRIRRHAHTARRLHAHLRHGGHARRPPARLLRHRPARGPRACLGRCRRARRGRRTRVRHARDACGLGGHQSVLRRREGRGAVAEHAARGVRDPPPRPQHADGIRCGSRLLASGHDRCGRAATARGPSQGAREREEPHLPGEGLSQTRLHAGCGAAREHRARVSHRNGKPFDRRRKRRGELQPPWRRYQGLGRTGGGPQGG